MSTTTEKVYRTTKEQCQSMISGVCSRCGGELKPIETVDNSGNPTYWSGCESCSVFDWGIDPEVFEIATRMVRKHHFICYPHIDAPGSKPHHSDGYEDYYWKSQIGGTSTLVAQILRVQRDLRKEKENQH